MGLTWRPMRPADLPAVAALAAAIHPHHPERPEVFAERLALAPGGCWMTEGGYAFAHPWTGAAPPPLDSLLGVLPAPPGAVHVHDIALLPGRRGRGLGRAALAAVTAGWPGLPVTLVAVPGLGPYWAALGFADAPCADPGALASYGAGARFMRHPGGPPP